MNIVEKEVKEFYRCGFLNTGKRNNLENLKPSLTSKLYDFNRDREKLDFLKILRFDCIVDAENHMKNCTSCGYDEDRKIGVFAIDQEIEGINKYFSFES